LPWERPGVRADVTKPFNLRPPEALKLKLDHIHDRTRVSVHEFVMATLIPAVEAELERLKRERRWGRSYGRRRGSLRTGDQRLQASVQVVNFFYSK
jgi:hypothetical protein